MRRRESGSRMRQILRLREIKFIFLRYHRAEECESGMNMRRDCSKKNVSLSLSTRLSIIVEKVY